MSPLYGATIKGVEHTHYIVENVWPSNKFGQPGVPDPDRERWSRHHPTAWNDAAAPNTRRNGFGVVIGNFDDVHADVANHPSRVGKAKWDSPVFTDPTAALEYAARLEKCGEVAARFGDGGTQADRDANYKGRAIRTRVVEQRLATVERVVEGMR